jgi:hypothetical protein
MEKLVSILLAVALFLGGLVGCGLKRKSQGERHPYMAMQEIIRLL